MVISKLKPNMIVYDLKKNTGISAFTGGKWRTWTVRVIEVDIENNRVFASWNTNKPQWYSESVWKKWRVNLPKDR